MPQIKIKPLSVNQAWQGKRFKSKEYKKFEEMCLWLLPSLIIPNGYLEIEFIFGVSNFASDYDNLIKPFQDVLQKKYNFNDSRIVKATQTKIKTKKGEEFIEFNLKKA